MKIEKGPMDDQRPSIEAKQHHYLHPDGEGFKAAIREAREILDVGGTEDEAAEWIGFTLAQLRSAIHEDTKAETAISDRIEPVIGRDTPGAAAA